MTRRLPAAALLVATWWWASAVPALAQDEVYDGRSTDDTVRLVVSGLLAIAVATGVLMLVYLWHTSPRRRLRVAQRRAARAEARAGGED